MSKLPIQSTFGDWLISKLNNERLNVKVISRFLFLAIIAGLISIVAPTAADDLTPQAEPSASPISESDTSTVEVLPPIDTLPATISLPVVNKIDTLTVKETLTSTVVVDTRTPTVAQPPLRISIPATLVIDPRANTKFVPAILLSGPEYLLACIGGSNLSLDIINKKVKNDASSSTLIVSGDLGGSLLVSGPTQTVVGLINSENGLMVTSKKGGLTNQSLRFDFVAMQYPAVNPTFCSASKNSKILTFTAMGLNMETVKNGINLK